MPATKTPMLVTKKLHDDMGENLMDSIAIYLKNKKM